MPIDLKRQTPTGLRNLLDNARRLHNAEVEQAVAREMHERDLATAREYAAFAWNPDRVDQVMERFRQVAASVPNNQRVHYTRAGGRKIGLPKDHSEHMWVDSYSAIRTPELNAVFGCEISKPGEEPKFTLYVGDGSHGKAPPSEIYNLDQLDRAFVDWQELARAASAILVECSP